MAIDYQDYCIYAGQDKQATSFIEWVLNKVYFYVRMPNDKNEKREGKGKKVRQKGRSKDGRRTTYHVELLFTPFDAFVWPQGNL